MQKFLTVCKKRQLHAAQNEKHIWVFTLNARSCDHFSPTNLLHKMEPNLWTPSNQPCSSRHGPRVSQWECRQFFHSLLRRHAVFAASHQAVILGKVESFSPQPVVCAQNMPSKGPQEIVQHAAPRMASAGLERMDSAG